MNLEAAAAYGLTPGTLKIIGYTCAVHFAVMITLWLIGRGHKNDSVLDIYWGFSFVIAVWIGYTLSPIVSARGRLVVALVTVWGARLGYHLFSRWVRIHGMGGDLRYQNIKDKLSGSSGYAMKALLIVYVPMWFSYVLSQLNMMLLVATPSQSPLGTSDYIYAGIMLCAVSLEITADLQLDAFKANHRNEGKVLDTGVWAWSRHPNYFANFCCFWVIYAISIRVPGLLWTIISPLFMSWLLIGFTGKRWLDAHMKKRRPGYAEYMANTSGFIPLPPKRR
jgi:steroid 5-alpha reductase family enzyme